MFMAMTGAFALATTISVTSREVRVRDLLQHTERLDPSIARSIVLRLRAGSTHIELPAAAVASLLRRRIPGFHIASPANDVVIEHRLVDKEGPRAGCFATLRTLRSGDPVTREMLVSAPCRATNIRTIGYGGNVATARHDLPKGSYVGHALVGERPVVARGMTLTLRSIAGPVTIERDVITLQAARSGQHVFVRDADGKVMAAPLALETAQ